MYLFGEAAVMTYRIIYCLLIMVTVLMIQTQDELATFMNLGTGLMLWANIPIMLIFGSLAMRAYHNYFERYRAGMMEPAHAAPKLSDVVSGEDVD